MIQHRNFVGIDVSKNRFDVYLHPSSEALAVANEEHALAALVRRLRQLKPVAIGLEASGGYEKALAGRLHAAGFAVYVVGPAQVRAFARAMKRHAKTDPIDAAMIARYLEAALDRLVAYAPDPQCEGLRELIAHRRRLVAERSALKGQLDTISEPTVRHMIAERLAGLALDILALDRAIRRTVTSDEVMNRRFVLLGKVTGVGPVLASTLIADLPELGRISAKRIASLVGVAPHARQSGRSDRRGRCIGGRRQVRDVLYMAALSAIKAKAPLLEPFYRRLRQNGKTFKIAITAVMRKFITILNAIVRDSINDQKQIAA